MKTPLPHQLAGCEYIIDQWKQEKTAYLWMEMRTGKTLTTMLALMKCPSDFRILILCPKSVMATWDAELTEAECPKAQWTLVTGTKAKREKLLASKTKRIFVCNWDMVRNYDLLGKEWDVIVADESRRLASHTSLTTKYFLKKREAGGYKVLLSGTPASEGETDLACQYLWGSGEFMGYKRYMDFMVANYKWVEHAYKWLPYKREFPKTVEAWVHGNSFGVKMKDVHTNLPKKLRRLHLIDPSVPQVVLMHKLGKTRTYEKDGKTLPMLPMVRAIFEREICSGVDPFTGNVIESPKFSELIGMYEEDPSQMLVLSEFTSPLEHLSNALSAKKIPHDVIDGSVKVEEREEIRKRFQAGEIRIVCAQTRTVKMGLDFSAASRIVYLSNGYSQDDRTQSEERATNLNKMDPVEIIDIALKGTIEPGIVKVLERKQDVSQRYIEEYYAGRTHA